MGLQKMSEKKAKIYFVGGINAAGKTTIVNEIKKVRPEFKIIQGSKSFMEWLGVGFGDYTTLRALPDDYKNAEFGKMIRWFIGQQTKKDEHLIIDAHYLTLKPHEVVDATGDWVSLIDALFVITAPCKEILDRMETDQKKTGRFRPIFHDGTTQKQKISSIRSLQERTVWFAETLSEKFRIPMFEIQNKNKKVAIAVEKFLKTHGLLNME